MGNAIKKLMWVGRTTATAMGLVVAVALVLGVATTALAAVPGDPLGLGQVNTINALTRLSGNVNGAMFRINNLSDGPSATALDLQVQPGKAPMTVNSQRKVTNLNADEVDGKSPGAFLPKRTYDDHVASTGDDIGGGARLAYTVCDFGDQVLSGGHSSLDAGTTLTFSAPLVDGEQGWQLRWINDGTADSIDVWVVCADYPPLRPFKAE